MKKMGEGREIKNHVQYANQKYNSIETKFEVNNYSKYF